MKKHSSFTERGAAEFIVAQVTAEAARLGRPLSATERKMLFFSESDRKASELAELAAAFDRECDQDEYERRIADLIGAARKRADRNGAADWRAAIERLERSDAYLGVMLGEALRRQSSAFSWRRVAALLIPFGLILLAQLGQLSYLGHMPTRDEQFFYVWLVMSICAVAYLISRWAFGASRVDGVIDRVIDRISGSRRPDRSRSSEVDSNPW